jgi:ATP-binding cassette subfamily C (CFTR/MRP) protein 1
MRDHAGFQLLMETTAVEENHEKEDHVNDDEVEDEKKTQKKKHKGPALMQAEEKAVKSVPWAVYIDYIRASGSIFNAPLVIAFLLASQGANIATSLWLSWWSGDSTFYAPSTLVEFTLMKLLRIWVLERCLYWRLWCPRCHSSYSVILIRLFSDDTGYNCE